MAAGDFFAKTESVLPGSALIVDGTTSLTGAVEVHTVASNTPVIVEKQVDGNGDGEFDMSVVVDESSSSIHSQKNKIEVSEVDNVRLKILYSTT